MTPNPQDPQSNVNGITPRLAMMDVPTLEGKIATLASCQLWGEGGRGVYIGEGAARCHYQEGYE